VSTKPSYPAHRERVWVTGAGGLLGGRLAALLAPVHELVAGFAESPVPEGLSTVRFDLLSPASLESAFDRARPRVVLHCAAMADADACERDPELARRTNVTATEALARLCRDRDARLVLLSTDMVFGGEQSFAREDDTAEPLSVYGRTKLMGEEAALAAAPGTCVLRVSLVCGRGHGRRGTASEAIAWSIRRGQGLRLFTDQYRTPVDPQSVADAVLRIIEREAEGRFHLGGPERVSRHELGLRVARVLDLPTEGIEAVPQSAAAFLASRPRDASLDASRARRELGWEPRPLDVAIQEGRI